jgi:hypothetical protein
VKVPDSNRPENRRWVSLFNRQNSVKINVKSFYVGQIQEQAPKRPFSLINKSYRSIAVLAIVMEVPSNSDHHQCQHQLRPFRKRGDCWQ